MTVLATNAAIHPRNASEARLLINVQARAARLYEDGYVARRIEPFRLAITGASGATYELDARDSSCTCPFFVKHEARLACKHLLGAGCLLKKQAAVLRHNAAHWEALA